MAQRGWHAIAPKTFVPKTSDGRADKPSPNLLSGQPLPTVPDRAWAGDITFIPTSHGWLYLAVVIDLCSRLHRLEIIDDHSRVVPLARLYPRESLLAHLDFLSSAFAAGGLPLGRR